MLRTRGLFLHCRYVHDDSETNEDQVELLVTDGVNAAEASLNIQVASRNIIFQVSIYLVFIFLVSIHLSSIYQVSIFLVSIHLSSVYLVSIFLASIPLSSIYLLSISLLIN